MLVPGGRIPFQAQFSSNKPGTLSNSRRLLVTRARPSLRAWAAMCRSLTPIGWPVSRVQSECCHNGKQPFHHMKESTSGSQNLRSPPDCAPDRCSSRPREPVPPALWTILPCARESKGEEAQPKYIFNKTCAGNEGMNVCMGLQDWTFAPFPRSRQCSCLFHPGSQKP